MLLETKKVQMRPMAARTLLLSGLALALLLALPGCKKFGTPDYKLTVSLDAGVTGTPLAGSYTHPDLTQVQYSYSAQDSDLAATVTMNGTNFAAEGTLTMYCDTEVVVKVLDVRGSWTVTLSPSDTSSSTITYEMTLAGPTAKSGSFSDDRGHFGTWSIASQTLTITYANWEKFILTGTVGTSQGGTYTNGDGSGTWSATRITG